MKRIVLLLVLALGVSACASSTKYGDSPRKPCGCDTAANCSDCCGIQDCRCSPNKN